MTNVNLAAYLLDENFILTEDADGAAIIKARAWLKNNYHLSAFGQDPEELARDNAGNVLRFRDATGNVRDMRMIDKIIEFARSEFGHLATHVLNIPTTSNIGIYKFIPGIIRIAISECGWFSEEVNTEMMDNLKICYLIALKEFIDGKQENPSYQGKYNADLNGLDYDELIAEMKDDMPAMKQKIESIGTQEGESSEVSEEEREAARQAAERARNTAGEYHIEVIKNFDEAKEWFKYTNPSSETHHDHFLGCRWCITEVSGHWDYYQEHFNNPDIYFCWKAPNKQALLAMNDHIEDYDGDLDDQHIPFSEYGLSLICIITKTKPDGKVDFILATSRYNHADAHGNRRLDSDDYPYFGDGLCKDGGKQKICSILGISEAEFDAKFKHRTDDNEIDHTEIAANLENRNTLIDLLDEFYKYNGTTLVKICHRNEWNIYNDVRKTLFSPKIWFTQIDKLNTELPLFICKFNGVQNIFNENGQKIIPVDVSEIYPINFNLAKVKLKNGKYNIINLATGTPLLKKPCNSIFDSNSFGCGIIIKDDTEGFKVINIKGKEILTLPEDVTIVSSNGNIICYKKNNTYIYLSKLNGKIIYKSNKIEPNNNFGKYIEVSNIDNDQKNIITPNGFLSNIWFDKIFSPMPAANNYIKVKTLNSHYNYLKPDGTLLYTDNLENEPFEFYRGVTQISGNEDNFIVDKNGEPIDVLSDYFIYVAAMHKQYNINTLLVYNKNHNNQFNIYNSSENKLVFDTDQYYAKEFIGYDNTIYYIMRTSDEKFTIVDSDGNIINSTPLPYYQNPQYIGFNYFLYSTDPENNKYNILTNKGKQLFKYPFTKMISASFSSDGIALIKAGNKDYYININGDVSRRVELI